MTKAEAIAMLKRIQEPEAWEPQINQAAFEALDMAIKALEQQPCEDTIGRQAAIDAAALSAAEWDGMYVQDINGRIREALEKLPSAQPEIIRCRNCKFANGDSRICMKFGHSPIGELDFCAWAERRTDEE